jgi:hypothetical protein
MASASARHAARVAGLMLALTSDRRGCGMVDGSHGLGILSSQERSENFRCSLKSMIIGHEGHDYRE